MDPTSLAMLTNAGMGYRPLAPGIPHARKFPTEGLPFTGGPLGGIAAMAATPHLMRLTGAVGMTPMGVGHDQNAFDRLMDQRFTMMQMQAMQAAAAADREAYARTFRGLAAVTGTPFGAEQRRAAHSLASAATVLSPAFAEIAPDFLDAMGGTRGSATVMARRLIDAGRYRIDPVTGRMGMSGESVGLLSTQMYGGLYADAGVLPQMHGVTAGQTGALVHELQARGMIGTAAAGGRYAGYRGDDPRGGVARAVDAMRRYDPGALTAAASNVGVDLTRGGGITPEDLDKLNLDPRVAERMRSLDVGRITRAVKGYVDVVSAMRDIFGDLGKPNAPMAELVAGVEALTMGGTTHMDPGRMAMMVRQTYNLAKQTGVTLGNAMMVQQHAANRAAQMGVEPAFAVQAAQGSLAFGGAYRAQGHAAHAAWGAMSADQVTQLDANLRVQAASSNAANRIAAAARMSEAVGGFAAGSDAARFLAAASVGLTQFADAGGAARSLLMTDRDFTRMMTAGTGFSEGDVQTMLGQRATNREYVDKLGLANVVRRLQGTDELHPFVGHRLQETLAARIRDHLVSRGVAPGDAMRQASAAASRVSQSAAGRIFAMPTEEFADTAARNAGIGGIIRGELEAAGLGGVVAGAGPEFFAGTAERFYGHANRAIAGSMYRAFGNLQNVHRLTSATTLDEADRQQMQARFSAEMQAAMAPLGRGSMLQRAADALYAARPDDPRGALGVIAQTLGGVRVDDINRSLMGGFHAVNNKRREVEALQDQVRTATDPRQRADLAARLDVARRELAAQAGLLAKTGEQFGLFSADTLTGTDLARALGSTKAAATALNDITGVRGNFGNEVSEAQLAAARGTALGPDDLVAIEASRRQHDVDVISDHLAGRGQMGKGQAALLDEWVAVARGAPGTRGMNADQLRRVAVSMLQANVRAVNPGDVKTADMTPDDWRAVVRDRRRRLPYRADKDAVADVKRRYPQMTEAEAAELADMQVRAQRLGVSLEDVEKMRRDNPGKYDGPFGELAAIGDAFAERAAARFDVTDADISALTASPGYRTPTAEAIDRFRDDNGLTGSAGDVVKEMQRRLILKSRQAAGQARWAKFWGSAEGAAARDAFDRAAGDVEDVAGRLVASPQMIQRLGTRGIEISDTLRADQQRLRELALFHAGGDVGRLMARDFSGVDWTRPGAAQTIARLNSEVTAITARQRGFLAELAGQDGLPGRRFQLGPEDAARRAVLDAEVAAGRMTRADADRVMGATVSPEMAARIDAVRRDFASEERVRGTLGLPLGAALTDVQLSKVAGLRFGAGAEAEARLIYGAERWDKLSPADREAAVSRLGAGLKTDDAAMQYLGVSAGQVAGDTSGDLAYRVGAAKIGLATNDHAEQLIGKLAARRPGESDKQYAERVAEHGRKLRAARLGLYNPALARERLGLPADELGERGLQSAVDRLREEAGNEAEALRLMGKRPGARLTDKEAEELKRLSYDVGIARRLRPGDEAVLSGLASREERLAAMASARGIDPGALADRGDDFVPTAEQMERIARARRNPLGADDLVGGDATARGVTVEEYLGGRGWIDRAGLAAFRTQARERDEHAAAVRDIAAGLGVAPGDLDGAAAVGRRLLAAQKNAYGRANADPAQLAREIFREYGFAVGDSPDKAEQDMARLMTTPAARGMAGRVLESSRTLKAAVGGRDAGAVADAYFRALRGSKADMDAFRGEHGLGDDEAFGRFETALQFQQQTGLLSAGRGDRAALTQLYADAVRGGAVKPADPQAAGQGRMELTGKVRLDGDVLHLTEVWGSSRAFTPGGP